MPKKPIVAKALTGLKVCLWEAAAPCRRLKLKGPIPAELEELKAGKADWLESLFPPDIPRFQAWMQSCVNRKQDASLDYRVVTEGTGLVWIRHWVFPSEGTARKKVGVIQVLQEQKLLEAECLRICERERSAIGQELHDDICQILAGLSCMMDVVGKQIHGVRPDLHSLLDELSLQIYGGMERTRALAHGLVPAKLVNLGLERALKELARQTTLARQVEVEVKCPAELPEHGAEPTLQVYRIAQEAVSNAIKHGKAKRIVISLVKRRENLVLTITDNGKGLPKKSSRSQGIGLHVMQFRTAILGGSFSLRSNKPGGVTVEVCYANPSVSHTLSPAAK